MEVFLSFLRITIDTDRLDSRNREMNLPQSNLPTVA